MYHVIKIYYDLTLKIRYSENLHYNKGHFIRMRERNFPRRSLKPNFLEEIIFIFTDEAI